MFKIQSITKPLDFLNRLPLMHSKKIFYTHYSSIHSTDSAAVY